MITYQVINGNSQTWGNFGGNKGEDGGQLTLTMTTGLPNLNQYSSEVSLDNSGVSYASNLTTLTLVAVRWYDSQGNLLRQVTTPQAVHPQN